MPCNTAIEHPPQLTGYFAASLWGSSPLSSTIKAQFRATLQSYVGRDVPSDLEGLIAHSPGDTLGAHTVPAT